MALGYDRNRTPVLGSPGAHELGPCAAVDPSRLTEDDDATPAREGRAQRIRVHALEGQLEEDVGVAELVQPVPAGEVVAAVLQRGHRVGTAHDPDVVRVFASGGDGRTLLDTVRDRGGRRVGARPGRDAVRAPPPARLRTCPWKRRCCSSWT